MFNLSSWAEKQQPLAEWLLEEFRTKYHIPKRIAQPWIEHDELLLLLDGLDEVKLNHRVACVKAINEFGQEHGLMPLAVCSRVADYEALTIRLNLHGAVLLQPLTPEQVDTYLAETGTALVAVREMLRSDATLQELAQSPLMLSIMTLAYRGLTLQELEPLDMVEARRQHLFDAYVRRMFERRGADRRYTPERTIKCLVIRCQHIVDKPCSQDIV